MPFGPPPLIEGEDPAAYDEFLTRISATVKPIGILEDIWVRDIVDLVWETFRMRRLKANLMIATAYKGLVTVLQPLVGLWNVSLAQDWARRDPDAIKKVDGILASAGLTMDAVMAHTLSQHIDDIERIERMIAMAEARRNAALREIEHHRATLAGALRRTVEQIEEDKYEILNPKSEGSNEA